MSDKMIVFLLVVSAFIGAFIANTLTTRRLTKLREEDLKRHQKQQLLQEILIRLDALCTPSMKLDVNKPVMTTHELSTVEIYRNGPVKQALFMYKRHYAVLVEAADITLWLTVDGDVIKAYFYSGLGNELNDLQYIHRELEKALVNKRTEKETTPCN
jgi:hypothetical protein